jgi:ribosome-associated protein
MTLFGKTTPKKSKARPKPARRPATKRDGKTQVRATPSDESKRIALLAAGAGLDKKATAVDILDVTGKVDYADFLVLMTGQNDRHVSAIAHAVDQALHAGGVYSVSVEGLPAAQWVLIDFVDVVVHVFLEEARSLYDLDGLWLDAGRIPVVDPSAPVSASANHSKDSGKSETTKATAAGKGSAKATGTKRSAKPTSSK